MNVGEWIEKRARVYPNRTFVKEGDRILNNREFDGLVNGAAQVLAERGVVKGDRVAVILENSIEFLEILFGCAKIGAVLTPINTQAAIPDQEFMLQDVTPRVVIYGPSAEGGLDKLKASSPEAAFLPLTGPEGSFAQLAGEAERPEFTPAREVLEHDPYIIIYVPGLTGAPKGAVLSHYNILFGAIHSILSYGINKDFKTLVLAPMSHIAGLAGSVFPLVYAAGTLILESFYNPSRILSMIVSEKINYLFGIPVMYQMMAKAPEWESADLSHVSTFISGGAPMPVEVIKKYQTEKGIKFAQGYGMTEAGRLTSLDLEDTERKAGSVGQEVFHVFLKIVDDQGVEVPTGELGEIIVRGPNVFSGYWNRPEETEAAFKDGWFITNDLGRRDEEGFIFLEGRKMETIISSGRNIYPVEVEKALLSLDGVKEAVVVGLPDPGKGQVVGAMVVGAEGADLTKEHLLSELHGKIAGYKLPKTILAAGNLPKNPAGMVDREEVRKLLRP